jgi:hypothetical protein
MATASFFRFDFLSNPAFLPGEERGTSFGPWEWFGKSANWTVWPFNLSTATRGLEITHVEARSRPHQPTGEQLVRVWVRNVGPDPVVIWNLFLGIIEP